MVDRRIRNLAVTGITIVSVGALIILGAGRPSASAMAAGRPGHAAVTTVASADRLATAPVNAAATARHVSAALPSALFGEFRNYNSIRAGVSLCLGISGNNTDADAVQWPCASDSQTWYEGATNSAGYYQIYWTTPSGTKQCLGVEGGLKTPLSQVVGWTCLGTSHRDQYWREDFNVSKTCAATGLSFFPIYNYGSGLVLGVAANSYAAGADIVIYPYQANSPCNNQAWTADAFSTGT